MTTNVKESKLISDPVHIPLSRKQTDAYFNSISPIFGVEMDTKSQVMRGVLLVAAATATIVLGALLVGTSVSSFGVPLILVGAAVLISGLYHNILLPIRYQATNILKMAHREALSSAASGLQPLTGEEQFAAWRAAQNNERQEPFLF